MFDGRFLVNMHTSDAPWYLWPIGFMILAVVAIRIGLWLARMILYLLSRMFLGLAGAVVLYLFLHRQAPVATVAVVEIPAVKMSPFAR